MTADRTKTDYDGPHDDGEEQTFFPGAVLLDRYRIESVLGRGGMGTVYLAEDRRLGQRVALKFLAGHLADRPKFVEMLLNEVRVARQVSHPNVCRVHDVGEIDGWPFLSMEYVDGEDLGSLLRRIGRMTGDKAHQIARQLCAGLFAAHEKGVLHRDLKPGNVMIDGDGNVRITDFGIATAVGAASIHDGPVGSPAYMAPELFRGAEASVRTDVYSLGLVLHELYTGKKLHAASSMSELLERNTSPPPPPSLHAPGLDRDVERAILSAIDPVPEKRPGSAMALLAMLPGGDPLAESLAAGKTPSPELIAAAGGTGGLAKSTAGALVGAVLVGLLLLVLADSDVKRIRRAPLPLPPDVLADRARGHLRTLGFSTDGVDAAGRFVAVDRRVDAHCATGPSDDDWTVALEDQRAATVEFWYRQTPRPHRFDGRDLRGRVGWDDPPPATPGEVRVRVDPIGRLVELTAVPVPTAAGAGPLDVDALLRASDLDVALLEPVPPTRFPATFADERFAWTGPLPEDPDRTVRVEAAAFAGRPVSLSVEVGPPPPTASSAAGTWRMVARIALILAALVLAFDAQRRGRGDPRGTFRVFVGVFALVVAFTLLAGDGTDWVGVGRLLQKGMMHGVAVGGMLALYYFAFEPHARHVWPQTMLGSSRLLAGRWLDPRVGRDVLIGIAMGVAVAAAAFLVQIVPTWTGCVAKPPLLGHVSTLDTLLGVGSAIGVALEIVVDFARESFKFFMAIVVIRLLLRHPTVTTAVAIAIWTLAWRDPAAAHADSLVAWLSPWVWAVALAGAATLVVVRFGLLALVVMFVTFGLLLTFPLSLDLSDWMSRVSLLALTSTVALSLLAARSATRTAPARPA